MHAEDLHCLYRQLRIELEAAYAARPRNAKLIDRIAADMLPLEAELALQGTATLARFAADIDAVSQGPSQTPADSGDLAIG